MIRTDQQRATRGPTNRIRGFTMVELLVAMAIVGLVLGAIYAVFTTSNRSYHTQDRVVDLQQGLRVGLDFMVRDIRMAGLSPRGGISFGIEEATVTKIRFASDSDWTNWASDGGNPAGDEITTYEYSTVAANCEDNAPCLRRGIGSSGSESWQMLMENVSDLRFEYYDAGEICLDGVADELNPDCVVTPFTVPAGQLDEIRTVLITVVSQDTNAEGQTFNRTLSTRLRCRNL